MHAITRCDIAEQLENRDGELSIKEIKSMYPLASDAEIVEGIKKYLSGEVVTFNRDDYIAGEWIQGVFHPASEETQDIPIEDLKLGDTLIRKGAVNKSMLNKATRIDKDDKNECFFVYTNKSAFYFTIYFGETVTILKRG